MESRLLGFCVLVAGLGIISAATGFAAEATRVKASDVYIEGDSCVYPSIIAVVLLLAAAGINNEAGGQFDSYGYVTCYVVKPGIYALGAVLALLSAVFGIAAYVTLISSTQETISPPVAFPSATQVDLEKC
ncbi:hypothetical protein L1987_81192 [Smallanthus sonchifolius]|uniref:Uncharacterized protein n=1 Tax=Smallanthus sonchifolius TaxID=185202 RepID=A0ACB8YR14_9ASTR|nr:hypothetical protein L1987_81192 [Smallanthus sonchifolius]